MSNQTRKIFNHSTGEMWIVEIGSKLETECLASGWTLDEKPPKAGGKAGDKAPTK